MTWLLAWLNHKPLKMVWKVHKDGFNSYLVGTAHFYPYSFSRSLRKLLERVDTILTEGPLDDDSMQKIADHGRDGNGSVDVLELLDPEAVQEINRLLAERLAESDGSDLYLLFHPASQPGYIRLFTQDARPWMALFSIWTTYLNWKYSVDLEAFQLAQRMGKQTLHMETIEEQIAVLDGIPLERVQRHLNDVKNWKTYRDHYVQHFLEGDLEKLVLMTERFPTRTPVAIGERDRIMFQRMKPVFERGPAAAFVGFPHVPGVRELFLQEGYTVSQGFE